MLTTWRDIRRRFAKEMRAFYSGSATGAQTTAGLVDPTWPVTRSSNVQVSGFPDMNTADLYEGAYLLRPMAGLPGQAPVTDRVRQIPPGGYIPLSGTINVDTPYATAPLVGEPYEIHGYGMNPWDDVLGLANEALDVIPISIEFSYAPLPFTREHDLTLAEPWLVNEDWVYQVGYLGQYNMQIQTLSINGSPTGGTFAVWYRGYRSTDLAYNVSAAILQAGLQQMPWLGNVQVAQTSQTLYSITMQDVTGPTTLFVTDSTSLTGGSSPYVLAWEQSARTPLVQMHGPIRKDGERVIITTPWETFNTPPITQDRLYVTARKPAFAHCAASPDAVPGGNGGDQGLSAEFSCCVPTKEFVVAAMMVQAWARYPFLLAEAEQSRKTLALAAAHLWYQRKWRQEWREPQRVFRILEPITGSNGTGHRFPSATPGALYG